MSEGKETLKESLVVIMQHNKKSKIIVLMSLVLLIAVVSGAVVLGESIGKTNVDITTDVHEQTALSTTKSVSLKSDFDSLLQNPNFQKTGFEIIEMKDPVKVDKETAIKTATAKETIGTYVSEQAKNITAVLVKLTNKEYPHLPGSDVVLQDLPVWIVTIHDVNILTSGGPKIPNDQTNNTSKNVVFGDVNVIIDADTGKEIETFSYKTNQDVINKEEAAVNIFVSNTSPTIKTDSGNYVGQADNNSIEIRISGVQDDKLAFRVFKISEEVRQTFESLSLKKDDEVKFSFYEQVIGQPVLTKIEKISK